MKTYISEIRKKEQMTQADLAEELGVTQGAIALWENSKRIPSLHTLYKLSRVLKVPVTSLVDGEMLEKIRSDHKLQDMDIPKESTAEWDYIIHQAKSNAQKREENSESEEYKILLERVPKLNSKGFGRLIQYMDEISQIPDYQRKDSSGKENNGDS
ncbi:MAG: helix-turn-helix transcriptional regulator [Firmicutes bacterium]|nr:helix-turn-helix transcriptional regulator [Bacillota bacterium]